MFLPLGLKIKFLKKVLKFKPLKILEFGEVIGWQDYARNKKEEKSEKIISRPDSSSFPGWVVLKRVQIACVEEGGCLALPVGIKEPQLGTRW